MRNRVRGEPEVVIHPIEVILRDVGILDTLIAGKHALPVLRIRLFDGNPVG
jgi:hypothetical protein